MLRLALSLAITLSAPLLGCSVFFDQACDDGLTKSPGGLCVACVAAKHCGQGEFCDRSVYQCVPPAESIFVAVDGVDSVTAGASACTYESPCGSVGFALGQVTPVRKNVVLQGGRYRSGQINIDGATLSSSGVTLVGSPPATLEVNPGDESAMVRIGGGARVNLVALTLERSGGSRGGSYGVECVGGSDLQLRESTVSGNADAAGLRALRCNTRIFASTFTLNQTGLLIEESNLEMVSSLVVNNSGSRTGGIELRRCKASESGCSASPDISITFSTIADNATSEIGGVKCVDLPAPIRAIGNIVQDNTGSANIGEESAGTMVPLATCQFTDSIAPESGEPLMPALFEVGGYELQADSPGRDIANLSEVLDQASIEYDLDGDPRLFGPAPDMGAQERQAK